MPVVPLPANKAIARMRGIQCAAPSRFHHQRLWNTGSPACAG